MTLSLTRISVFLTATNILAVGLLMGTFGLYRGSISDVIDARSNQYISYLLADELRQSSDDLTRLGRTYVITGDEKYEKQYFDILDIRNGKKPRPENYHQIYWDFYTVDMKKPRGDGETISLNDLMIRAKFTESEFEFLKQAQANSDGLVGLEVKAMNAVKGKFADPSGNYTVSGEPDFELARNLVHSEEYHRFKSEIMHPLNAFFIAMEKRTTQAIIDAEAQSQIYAWMAVGAIILMVIAAGLSLWAIRFRVLSGLTRLKEVMVQLSKRDTAVEVPDTARSDEIGEMARTVNIFKQSIIEREELGANRRAEEAAKDARTKAIDTLQDGFRAEVGAILDVVTGAVETLKSSSGKMSEMADNTSQQANSAAAATEEASANVQSVASATEELSSSIAEISRQVGDADRITTDAKSQADATNHMIEGLSESVSKIGEVVNLITAISEQTNLLALNATIEAARAGDAGKGFAVVASEVKNLANQTGSATDEIAGQISTVQAKTSEAVTAIRDITQVIDQIGEISKTISSSIEQQGIATDEIALNVQQASTGTSEVASNVSNVNQSAEGTGQATKEVSHIAEEVEGNINNLRSQVETFMDEVRKA